MYIYRKVELLGKYTFEYADQKLIKRQTAAWNASREWQIWNMSCASACECRGMRSWEGSVFFCNFDRTPLTRQQFISLHFMVCRLLFTTRIPFEVVQRHQLQCRACLRFASNPWASGQLTLIRYIIFVLPILSSRLILIFCSYYPILHRYKMTEWKNGWRKERRNEWMNNWNRYKSLYRPWWLPRWLLPKFVYGKMVSCYPPPPLPHPIIPCLGLHITWHTSGLPGSYFHFLFIITNIIV